MVRHQEDGSENNCQIVFHCQRSVNANIGYKVWYNYRDGRTEVTRSLATCCQNGCSRYEPFEDKADPLLSAKRELFVISLHS